MERIDVLTPSHNYPIYIGANLNYLIEEHLFDYISSQVVVVSNQTVAPLYLETLEHSFKARGVTYQSIILPDGEQYKNYESLNIIYDELLVNNIARDVTLIALGGGVIGDMAGFAAATYQRGIPFIQIPTTLLSQVDSSVGGKTAINHPLGKNMIGAFYQPQAVLIATDTLKSLPNREFSAGMAEVIKYALLGNIEFLCWLEENIEPLMQLDANALNEAISVCCRMKAAIVAADEKEKGQRALLNLGHTFGHAIETQMGYGVWLHGEAVSAGMVLACYLSEYLGKISKEDICRVSDLLSRARLPINPPVFAFSQWMAHMQHDKKVLNGKIRFVILEKLGRAQLEMIENETVLKDILSSDLEDKFNYTERG